MTDKIYSVEEIRQIAAPLARQYGIGALYLFGSYARGEARPNSDIDLRVEKGKLTNLLQLGGLYCDLEEKLGKPLDLLTTQMLSPDFLRSIQPEEVLLYDGNA
ncbi:MAG: nucleotidyltransferase domain-containing protein [Clostridia bacterium]|nr:nucleotidyltransferase domain-containing protein [Clostridia bacterium]